MRGLVEQPQVAPVGLAVRDGVPNGTFTPPLEGGEWPMTNARKRFSRMTIGGNKRLPDRFGMTFDVHAGGNELGALP